MPIVRGPMIKLFRRRTKLNQKGMTLVEVIVAMAILTIVVVPTLRMFASASSTNHTSRLRQRATIVGESVMESFKAFDMETLCKQFRDGKFPGVTADTGVTTMSVTATIDGSEKSPFRPDDELDEDATAYTFKANNVLSEGQYYDVMVEAKPIAEPDDILRMDSPNAYSDAIIKFDQDFNDRIYADMVTTARTLCTTDKGSLTSFAITDVKLSDFSRNITLDVDDSGSSQQVKVSVDCTCKATVSYSYRALEGGVMKNKTDSATYTEVDMGTSVTLPDATSTETTWTVYDNSATIAGTSINGRKCKLNQIYLYYYPVYASTFGIGAFDVITLDANLTKLYDPSMTTEPEAEGYLPLYLNIAKQLDTSVTDATLNNNEMAHSTRIDGSITGGGKAVLTTNVSKNLSTIGSVMSPVTIIPGFSEIRTFDTDPAGEVELLYDLTVHVYKNDKNGVSEEVATFKGTKND